MHQATLTYLPFTRYDGRFIEGVPQAVRLLHLLDLRSCPQQHLSRRKCRTVWVATSCNFVHPASLSAACPRWKHAGALSLPQQLLSAVGRPQQRDLLAHHYAVVVAHQLTQHDHVLLAQGMKGNLVCQAFVHLLPIHWRKDMVSMGGSSPGGNSSTLPPPPSHSCLSRHTCPGSSCMPLYGHLIEPRRPVTAPECAHVTPQIPLANGIANPTKRLPFTPRRRTREPASSQTGQRPELDCKPAGCPCS